MIIALLVIGVVVVAFLMYCLGLLKNDNRLIVLAPVYLIAVAIAHSILFGSGLAVSEASDNSEESESEQSGTIQTTMIQTTYVTTVINGTEYKLVPSDQ